MIFGNRNLLLLMLSVVTANEYFQSSDIYVRHDTVTITSPAYPSSYENNKTYTWHITTAKDNQIQINFKNMSLVKNVDPCLKGFLTLQGATKKYLCNADKDTVITSMKTNLTLVLQRSLISSKNIIFKAFVKSIPVHQHNFQQTLNQARTERQIVSSKTTPTPQKHRMKLSPVESIFISIALLITFTALAIFMTWVCIKIAPQRKRHQYQKFQNQIILT